MEVIITIGVLFIVLMWLHQENSKLLMAAYQLILLISA
jgi:hypothetical protein